AVVEGVEAGLEEGERQLAPQDGAHGAGVAKPGDPRHATVDPPRERLADGPLAVDLRRHRASPSARSEPPISAATRETSASMAAMHAATSPPSPATTGPTRAPSPSKRFRARRARANASPLTREASTSSPR